MPAEATLTINLQAGNVGSGGAPRQPFQPQPQAPVGLNAPAAATPTSYGEFYAQADVAYERQRRLIDEVFNRQKILEEERLREAEERRNRANEPKSFLQMLFTPRSPEARQSAAFAAMGFGAAGMGSAAAVAGGFAGMGPAGAALAVIDQVSKQLKQISDNIFKPIASLDAKGLAHGFAEMAEKVPIVGQLLGGFAKIILSLSDAVNSTAQRLSAFSGPLAAQQAMIDVRQIQRDMQRAIQFGPQIGEVVNASFELEQRIEALLDRNLPMILSLVSDGIELLGGLMTTVETLETFANDPDGSLAAGFAGIMISLNELVGNVPGGEFWFGVLEQLGIMARNTTPAGAVPLPGLFVQQILNNIQRPDAENRFVSSPAFSPPPAFRR